MISGLSLTPSAIARRSSPTCRNASSWALWAVVGRRLAPIACTLSAVWLTIGHPLPRARDAYAEPIKWSWILGAQGHGPHWQRVFGLVEQDADRLWSAIAAAALGSPVVRVRAGPWGLGCDIRPVLELNQRTAAIVVAWHYSDPDAAPRLVTAYPTP